MVSSLFSMTERTSSRAHLQWRTNVHRMLERADVPLRTVEFLYIVVGAAFARR